MTKRALVTIGSWLLLAFAAYVIFWAYPAYLVRKHLAEGWVTPTGWDCPADHPIKANLKSMIYHLPGDPYWNRTNAMSGECFNTTDSAEKQGFRASIGTPHIYTAPPTSSKPYEGVHAPDGTFCPYGYRTDTKSCCDEDDYTCEFLAKAPKGATAMCVDQTYSTSQNPTYDCMQHGGVETSQQVSPFAQ